MSNIEKNINKPPSPYNKALLQSMTEEIVERMCIISEGEEKMTHEHLTKSMIRALKNHGIKSKIEDYIVELLPLIDKAIKNLEQKQPKEKKGQKKGFSGLINIYPENKSDPNNVTIESLGIEISFRVTRGQDGRQKLLETSRMKLGSRSTDRDSLRFPDEIYKALIRIAWAVLKDRQKNRNK
jgi:hypothetical protein